MDYKYIYNNINKIKLGDNVKKNKNIIIPILFENNELYINIPKNKRGYFELHKLDINSDFFNYYLTLEEIMNIDEIYEFEEEYKNDVEKIQSQKEAYEFRKFIIDLKNKLIECFFKELKINKNYLDINFKELNLEYHELNKSIWNENIDFSYKPEIKKIDYDHDSQSLEIKVSNRLHVNKITKKSDNLILKCNIIFINKRLDHKKHIFIEWILI